MAEDRVQGAQGKAMHLASPLRRASYLQAAILASVFGFASLAGARSDAQSSLNASTLIAISTIVAPSCDIDVPHALAELSNRLDEVCASQPPAIVPQPVVRLARDATTGMKVLNIEF